MKWKGFISNVKMYFGSSWANHRRVLVYFASVKTDAHDRIETQPVTDSGLRRFPGTGRNVVGGTEGALWNTFSVTVVTSLAVSGFTVQMKKIPPPFGLKAFGNKCNV